MSPNYERVRQWRAEVVSWADDHNTGEVGVAFAQEVKTCF